MKYEMIFGDPSQFEGMMPDCEFVDGNYGYKNNRDIFYYCERYNEKFGWAFSHKTNLEFRPIAMRRIIKDKVDDENELENLYWEFDSQRSKKTTDERLLFKGKLRYYASIASVDKSTKEPKRWTWEDKKAGVPPEVGCRAIWHDDNGMKYTVKIETAFFGNECAVSIDDEAIYFAEKFCLFPIETPAEKSQREEDEFVESICRQNEPHSTLYDDGVRAAYRKLKGGE